MQVERLLQMIFLLIKKEKVTTQELADYFDVSKRTILRDIDTLSMANIPIDPFTSSAARYRRKTVPINRHLLRYIAR